MIASPEIFSIFASHFNNSFEDTVSLYYSPGSIVKGWKAGTFRIVSEFVGPDSLPWFRLAVLNPDTLNSSGPLMCLSVSELNPA